MARRVKKYVNHIINQHNEDTDNEHEGVNTINNSKQTCKFCGLAHPTDNCCKL